MIKTQAEDSITRYTKPFYHKGEISHLWDTIGAGHYSASRAKSSEIRNPAVRFVFKLLAESFFGRKETGGVKESDLSYLLYGVGPLLEMKFASGKAIHTGNGERINAVAAFVRVLLDIQKYAWTHKDQAPVLKIGGLITPILMARGINLEMHTDDIPPSFINESQMAKWQMLSGRLGSSYAYRFNESKGKSVQILLPNPSLTSVTVRRNLVFEIPRELQYNAAIHGSLTAMSTSRHAPQEEPAQGEEEEETEMVYGSARYYFEPYDQGLKKGPLYVANQHIHSLKRWNKWQDRGTRKLAAGFDKMKKQLDSFKKLLGKKNKPQKRGEAEPEGDDAGPSMPSQHRHSMSEAPSLALVLELQRSATTGRRQRRRMKTPSPPISDNESLDFDMDFSPPPSCSPPQFYED